MFGFGKRAGACPQCGGKVRSMRCTSCRGNGTKGLFFTRDCAECGATGRKLLCLNVRCSRFDGRLYEWYRAWGGGGR